MAKTSLTTLREDAAHARCALQAREYKKFVADLKLEAKLVRGD
jgi:hypothetical protein